MQEISDLFYMQRHEEALELCEERLRYVKRQQTSPSAGASGGEILVDQGDGGSQQQVSLDVLEQQLKEMSIQIMVQMKCPCDELHTKLTSFYGSMGDVPHTTLSVCACYALACHAYPKATLYLNEVLSRDSVQEREWAVNLMVTDVYIPQCMWEDARALLQRAHDSGFITSEKRAALLTVISHAEEKLVSNEVIPTLSPPTQHEITSPETPIATKPRAVTTTTTTPSPTAVTTSTSTTATTTTTTVTTHPTTMLRTVKKSILRPCWRILRTIWRTIFGDRAPPPGKVVLTAIILVAGLISIAALRQSRHPRRSKVSRH
ncbi:hypothetical protein Pelo_16008 [Pelomyxa schiedti]|nr:hypothetical protein Pelo_16008 [Pelomyxa schiedti]